MKNIMCPGLLILGICGMTWSYQDYRTLSNFVMGLVDFNRNRRGSWEVLREEYAPVLIDFLILSPIADDKRTATVTLHTRSPIDVDMPAYTLRDYSLHWQVTSPGGTTPEHTKIILFRALYNRLTTISRTGGISSSLAFILLRIFCGVRMPKQVVPKIGSPILQPTGQQV